MTKPTVTIENADTLTRDEQSVLNAISTNPGTEMATIESAEKHLTFFFVTKNNTQWLVYRGSNHIALIKNGTRVLLVAFREA